MMMKKSP